MVDVDVGSSITLCFTAAFRGFPFETKLSSGLTISDFIGVFVLTRILLFCLLFSLLCSSLKSPMVSILTRLGKISGSVLYWATSEFDIDLGEHLGRTGNMNSKTMGNLKLQIDQVFSTLFRFLLEKIKWRAPASHASERECSTSVEI